MSVTKVISKAVADAIGSVHPCGVPEQIKGLASDAALQAVQQAAEEAISVALEVIESKLIEEGYELAEGLVEGILQAVFHGEAETTEESEAT